jgi:hypothetical protein
MTRCVTQGVPLAGFEPASRGDAGSQSRCGYQFRHRGIGGHGGTRTYDQGIRNPLFYPAELRALLTAGQSRVVRKTFRDWPAFTS